MLTRASNRNKTKIDPSIVIETPSNLAVNKKTKIIISKKRTETEAHTLDNLIVRKVLDRLNGSNQSLILHGIEKTKS